MACFLVPTAEAIVTSVLKKSTKKVCEGENAARHPFLSKLGLLNNMLWGGSALLAFEHIWHGEITPWAPFLTATSNPQAASEMIHEMMTSGIAMAALVTIVWAGIAAVSNAIGKKNLSVRAEAKKG